MKEDGPPITPILYDRPNRSAASLQYYGRALRQPMSNEDMVNPWAIVQNHADRTVAAHAERMRELEVNERRNHFNSYYDYVRHTIT